MSKLSKIRDGVLQGVGIVAVLSITGLAYASYTWVSQATVTTGDTLTASAWNDMLNNQNYLKQEVEARLQNSGGSMSGNLDMSTNKVTNLGTPTASSDAATKAYADSVGASAGGGYPRLCTTSTLYNGNLGGFSGADSKCAASCGVGFEFAKIHDVAYFNTINLNSWINSPGESNCSSWTEATSNHVSVLHSDANGWKVTTTYNYCNQARKITCVKY